MAAVHSSSVIVGLHADASTEAIVDVALKYNKSFAVVPCCVFPNLFKDRRTKSGDVVRSYEQFCEYLEDREDGVVRDELGFHGRNVCLYYRGREVRSLKTELGESRYRVHRTSKVTFRLLIALHLTSQRVRALGW